MKTLELNQMENLQGGEIDCGEGFGLAVGVSASIIAIGIATGGVGLVIFGFSAWLGGGLLAGSNDDCGLVRN